MIKNFLRACLLLPVVISTSYAHQSHFTDVPVTHPAFEQIDFVAENGILPGFQDQSFKPNIPLPPAELRAALVRLVGEARAATIWQDLQHAKGGRPLARGEAAVLLSRIALGEQIDFKKPLELQKYSSPADNEAPSKQPVPSENTVTATSACPKAADFFSQFSDVTVRCDSSMLYIESSGMPAHEMMVGITSSNQQVPLPQYYRGANAWKIPLHPVAAPSPVATNGGPVGIAVNGVPIFDPHKQGGVGDTKKEGELDVCNGHAGRADDYHYHAAPVCLMKQLGRSSGMIGFALDGYPINGFVDSSGSRRGLDSCNGKMEAGSYSYYVTAEYPYTIGCFRGVANLDMLPRAQPIRPPGEPIRNILITGLHLDNNGWWIQTWEKGEAVFRVKWKQATDTCWDFVFVNAHKEVSERYCRR